MGDGAKPLQARKTKNPLEGGFIGATVRGNLVGFAHLLPKIGKRRHCPKLLKSRKALLGFGCGGRI